MSGTRQKIQSAQMRLAFVEESRGKSLDAPNEGTESLVAKRAPESPANDLWLMEEVCERTNVKKAWQRVRANKGGPGVDGLTIGASADYLREHWPTIRQQLLEGTYAPQPVKRVEIPKPGGGMRWPRRSVILRKAMVTLWILIWKDFSIESTMIA